MKIDKTETKLLNEVIATQYIVDDTFRALVSVDMGRLHLSASYLDRRHPPSTEEMGDIIEMVFKDKPWFLIKGGVKPNVVHIWEALGNGDDELKAFLEGLAQKLKGQRQNWENRTSN